MDLRFRILGLSSAKDEIEASANQGQFDSMRDDDCQRLHRAIVKQNGYVELEELTTEEERCVKFLEKGNQKMGTRENGRKTHDTK